MVAMDEAVMAKKRKPLPPEEAKIMRHFGRQVARAREHRHWSQMELGRRVGLSGAMIGFIELGEVNTNSSKVAQIADALGVSVDSLYPLGTPNPIRALQQQLVALPPEMAATLQPFFTDIIRRLSPSSMQC